MSELRRMQETGEIFEVWPMYASPLLGPIPLDALDDWPMSEDWVVMVVERDGKRLCMPVLRMQMEEWSEEIKSCESQ